MGSNFNGVPVIRTLMLTDFVGSTRFVETLGDVVAAEIFALHDRLARDLLHRFGGQEIDKTDGFLFVFERPIDAVNYALAYNDALTDMSNDLEITLTARTGIHLGEVILRENAPEDVARGAKPVELEGLAKPMAARIMSLAQGKQILLTHSAYEMAKRAALGNPDIPDDLEWAEHGAYMVKGVSEPLRIYEAGRAGVGVLSAPPDTEKARRAPSARGGTSRVLLVALSALGGGFVLLLVVAAILFFGFKDKLFPATPAAKVSAENETPAADKADGDDSEVPKDDKANADKAEAQGAVVDKDAPEPDKVEENPPGDEAEPKAFALRVVSEPEGAKVRWKRDTFGPTPIELPVEAKKGRHRLKVSMRGFTTARTICSVSEEDIEKGESVCTVKLKRKGKRGGDAAAKGDAPPAKKGGDTGEKPKIHMID